MSFTEAFCDPGKKRRRKRGRGERGKEGKIMDVILYSHLNESSNKVVIIISSRLSSG